jgi:hypothetical protein
MDTYGHLSNEVRRETADKMDQILAAEMPREDPTIAVPCSPTAAAYASRCSLKGSWRSRSIVLEKVKSWLITLPQCQAPENYAAKGLPKCPPIVARTSTRGIVRDAA